MTGDDTKKTKTLTGIQVLTKDFTSHKIRSKSYLTQSTIATNILPN